MTTPRQSKSQLASTLEARLVVFMQWHSRKEGISKSCVCMKRKRQRPGAYDAVLRRSGLMPRAAGVRPVECVAQSGILYFTVRPRCRYLPSH
jgi:hypothetical protein